MNHNLKDNNDLKDNLPNFVKTPPYLNVFINPPFYHLDYFFLNNILGAVLCSAEKQMNTHNHSSFGISSCKSFINLWADTYTSKLSKSWQLNEAAVGFLQSPFSHLCCLFWCNRFSSESVMGKFIYSINGCGISSQQTGAVGIRHQPKRSLLQPQEKGLSIGLYK